MKKKYLSVFVILISMHSCNQSGNEVKTSDRKEEIAPQEKKVAEKNDIKNLDGKYFDTILNCGDYVYVDNFFRMIDNGCVYNPASNPSNEIGWCDVVLTLKNDDKKPFRIITEDEIIKQEGYVNKMTSVELKQKFPASASVSLVPTKQF